MSESTLPAQTGSISGSAENINSTPDYGLFAAIAVGSIFASRENKADKFREKALKALDENILNKP